MLADDPKSRNHGGDDTYRALVDRCDHAQRLLDEAVAIMNVDSYLMTGRLPGMTGSKDQAVYDLAAALTALKAAQRGGYDTQMERGQWGVIDAARTLCQVTGGNFVELSVLLATGLASFNTAGRN